MKGSFKELREDRIIFRGLIVTYLILILSLAYILLKLGNLPPYIPLYNQLPWGDERLAPTLMIFLPSAITVAVSIINLVTSSFIYSRSQIIARMLSITSTLISFLSFLFTLRTIQLIS